MDLRQSFYIIKHRASLKQIDSSGLISMFTFLTTIQLNLISRVYENTVLCVFLCEKPVAELSEITYYGRKPQQDVPGIGMVAVSLW